MSGGSKKVGIIFSNNSTLASIQTSNLQYLDFLKAFFIICELWVAPYITFVRSNFPFMTKVNCSLIVSFQIILDVLPSKFLEGRFMNHCPPRSSISNNYPLQSLSYYLTASSAFKKICWRETNFRQTYFEIVLNKVFFDHAIICRLYRLHQWFPNPKNRSQSLLS